MSGAADQDDAWRSRNAGQALGMASAVFEREVLRTVRAGEFGWVSQVQLALFRNLGLDGANLTELAARARITKQSMQELVDKSERAGVVVRSNDPKDRRSKLVMFTPDGLRMLEQFRQGVAEAERRMATALGEDFLIDLKARLLAYVDASGWPAAPCGAQKDPGEGETAARDLADLCEVTPGR